MSQASDRLALYLAAERKILSGQSVRMGDRQLSFADLDSVRSEIGRLNAQVANEAATAAGAGGKFVTGFLR